MDDHYVFVVEFDELNQLLEELENILRELEPEETEEEATSFFSSFERIERVEKEQNFEESASDEVDFDNVKPFEGFGLVFNKQPNLKALDFLKDKCYRFAEKHGKTIMGFKILKRTHEVIYEE